MYHIQGTSHCIDNFSDVDFLEDNSIESNEAIQYWSES